MAWLKNQGTSAPVRCIQCNNIFIGSPAAKFCDDECNKLYHEGLPQTDRSREDYDYTIHRDRREVKDGGFKRGARFYAEEIKIMIENGWLEEGSIILKRNSGYRTRVSKNILNEI